MTLGPMAASLVPLRNRMQPAVREREILRVSASIVNGEPATAFAQARREVLAWAQNRSGGRLPESAWRGESFEYMLGGRTTLGASVSDGDSALWALRGDDPDKTVPGRIWTTEFTIGQERDGTPQISLRSLVSSPEAQLDVAPHVPGLLQQICEKSGLRIGNFEIKVDPWEIRFESDALNLISFIESPSRNIPVIVASGDERSTSPERPWIDVTTLARATLGLAQIVAVPARFTYALSDVFGKIRSVFHGAVRVYMPGFDSASDPYNHRLLLSEAVRQDPEGCSRDLRWLAAFESLKRTKLGFDVLPFAAVRSTALRIEREIKADAGVPARDQLEIAKRAIDALKTELKEAQNQADLALDEAISIEQRAKNAESQLFSCRSRIQQLEQQLLDQGYKPDADLQPPEAWDSFSEWCDQNLISRLVLTPTARNEIKKAAFGDITLAARCLVWLAGICRERRINGGGSIANIPIEPGVENAPCGADSFSFGFQGRDLTADWHVKRGGNTRDPSRCLRIYYSWDEATQLIVVASMPSHRRTGAT